MKTFNLSILAADIPFYLGPCESLVVPSVEGKYGILAHHSNMIIATVPGEMTFRVPGQEAQVLAVSHGIVKIEDNEVLVLAESVERPEDIDANRAQRAADAAREAMLQNRSIYEFRSAQAMLAKALNRLNVKSKYSILHNKNV